MDSDTAVRLYLDRRYASDASSGPLVPLINRIRLSLVLALDDWEGSEFFFLAVDGREQPHIVALGALGQLVLVANIDDSLREQPPGVGRITTTRYSSLEDAQLIIERPPHSERSFAREDAVTGLLLLHHSLPGEQLRFDTDPDLYPADELSQLKTRLGLLLP